MDDDEDLEEGKEVPFISLENVHKTYLLGIEGIAALRGVDIQINEGEFVMICGTSGGGKSTMLNIMGTIDKPTKGRVTLCGKIITPRTSDDELAKIRLENLGFVFQTFNLLSSMTALENVELPLTFLGYGAAKRKEIAKRLLESVQMGDRLQHYPNMLSGGEQQRVTIARAMANSPGLLLLDEPTGDLDTLNTNNVMRLLVNLNKKGITLVMVTHDMNLVPYCTRVVLMRDGRVSGSRVNSPEERELRIQELERQIALGRDGSKGTDHLNVKSDPTVSSSSSSTSSSSSSSSFFSSSNASNIIPVCSSVREPGDYDPIFFADASLSGVGYEITIGENQTVVPMRPFHDNPYSNLRRERKDGSNASDDDSRKGRRRRKGGASRDQDSEESVSENNSERDSHNSSKNSSKNGRPAVFVAADPNGPPPPSSSTLPPLLSTTPSSMVMSMSPSSQGRTDHNNEAIPADGRGRGTDQEGSVGYRHPTFDPKFEKYTDDSTSYSSARNDRSADYTNDEVF